MSRLPTLRVKFWVPLANSVDSSHFDYDWLCGPDRPDGTYPALLSQNGGAEAYGLFCAICAVWRNHHSPGVLSNDSGPITISELSRRTGFTVEQCKRGIRILSSPEIGWLVPCVVDEHGWQWKDDSRDDLVSLVDPEHPKRSFAFRAIEALLAASGPINANQISKRTGIAYSTVQWTLNVNSLVFERTDGKLWRLIAPGA